MGAAGTGSQGQHSDVPKSPPVPRSPVRFSGIREPRRFLPKNQIYRRILALLSGRRDNLSMLRGKWGKGQLLAQSRRL